MLRAARQSETLERDRDYGSQGYPGVGRRAADQGTRPGGFTGLRAVRSAIVVPVPLHDTVLAGHSMGTGEVTRYLGRYGSARVARGVLVAPIPLFLLQTPDNPDGVPRALFDGFAQAAAADTPAWMKGFLDNFYSSSVLPIPGSPRTARTAL